MDELIGQVKALLANPQPLGDEGIRLIARLAIAACESQPPKEISPEQLAGRIRATMAESFSRDYGR